MLLLYDPAARLPPLKAMMHRFFDQLRQEDKPLHKQLFNFLPEEFRWCLPADVQKLMPDSLKSKIKQDQPPPPPKPPDMQENKAKQDQTRHAWQDRKNDRRGDSWDNKGQNQNQNQRW